MSRETVDKPVFTEMQAKFVQEYLIDLNAGQAAKRAGYSDNACGNLYQQGSRLLRVKHVSEAINIALQARSERTEIRQDRVVAELARIAFSDVRKVAWWDKGAIQYYDSDSLDDETAASISEISDKTFESKGKRPGDDSTFRREQRIKLHDKMRALELLGRHLGMFAGEASAETNPVSQLLAILASGAITVDDLVKMIPEKKS